MTAHIMLIVVFISAIQTMFGAGVSLFGTPLLLFFGHDFVDVLILLLPISLAINSLQILQHYAHINFVFYRKMAVRTLPPIVLFLFLITHAHISIGLIIGPFLLLIASKEFFPAIATFINRLMRYETPYFITVGIVHGLSNLGGSLLTAFIHHQHYPKDVSRVTVAACYATFAVIQLLTLWLFSAQEIHVPFNENMVYLIVGVMVFEYIDAVFYAKVNTEKYRSVFALFLAFSGGMLILKSLF